MFSMLYTPVNSTYHGNRTAGVFLDDLGIIDEVRGCHVRVGVRYARAR